MWAAGECLPLPGCLDEALRRQRGQRRPRTGRSSVTVQRRDGSVPGLFLRVCASSPHPRCPQPRQGSAHWNRGVGTAAVLGSAGPASHGVRRSRGQVSNRGPGRVGPALLLLGTLLLTGWVTSANPPAIFL